MRIPVATYRLQVTDDFTLHDATAIVPFLARLGISDLYLSPIFEARRGSTHGYDVVDPTRVRESIGGMAALHRLSEEVRRHDMGILLDIVPNHMAASAENPWWRDVLACGRDSAYADYFDIDWSGGRLQLPVLGDHLDALLGRGEISIDEESCECVYHETRLPLTPRSGAVSAQERLAAQHYELVPWRRASERMSYRRFFDISDLVGVRVEDERVFRATHELIRSLAADGIVTGLRIDHIDGLRDPAAYLTQLRAHVRGPDGGPLYTVVEKILERTERLPEDWACEGTTGYDFLNLATAALVQPDGHAHVEAFYSRISGDPRAFDDLVHEKKLLVMQRLFGSELKSLSRALAPLLGAAEDAAMNAVRLLTASMQVYRTYICGPYASHTDRRRIMQAYEDAERRHGPVPLLDALRDLLLREDAAAERIDWIMRWQQFTGPVMAKGFEDTALYCHNALLAANEVGSDPTTPCLPPHELYAALAARAATQPRALNATATHDTKRGEDTRARIAVLSEVPGEWRAHLRRWMREGDAWKAEIADDEDAAVPSADVDSLLYQTLLGAWPLDGADEAYRDRVKAYMTKAVREAKEQTSWRRPDEDFEQGLDEFIDRIMAALGREGLSENIAALAERIAPHGAMNSLTQMLLKCTAPGIPDFYQGTELWSFTLVDPDNRQPVDHEVRRRMLDDVAHLRDLPDAAGLARMLGSWRDGRIKMLLTALALRFRARHRDAMEHGAFIPLPAQGERADHLLAFARGTDEHACIIVLPRWTTSLFGNGTLETQAAVWGDTHIPLPDALRRTWHNALTRETVRAEDGLELRSLFGALPFALLEPYQPVGA